MIFFSLLYKRPSTELGKVISKLHGAERPGVFVKQSALIWAALGILGPNVI